MVIDVARHLEFIYTPLFNGTARGLLDDEAMRQVELTLPQKRALRVMARALEEQP